MGGDHRQGRQRRAVWTVLTGGQTGPADQDGRQIRIQPLATSFKSRTRARQFASNVKGARVVGPPRGKGFWTAKRLLIALVVVVFLVAVFCR